MVAQWPQTAAPVWDSRIGLLQVMKALWTTLDTWHVGLNFFYKKGMRNFKLKAPKKRLIDCVYGHSMKNSVYFRNTSFKKKWQSTPNFQEFFKKRRLNKLGQEDHNLQVKVSCPSWAPTDNVNYQANPTIHRFLRTPNSLGAPGNRWNPTNCGWLLQLFPGRKDLKTKCCTT